MGRRSGILTALAFLLLTVAQGAGAGPTLHGYVKGFGVRIQAPELEGLYPGSVDSETDLITSLRLRMFWAPSPAVSAEAAYQISPWLQKSGRFLNLAPASTGTGRLSYRFLDLDETLLGPEGDPALSVRQNLDRALVTISRGSADLTVGRQAISLGTARVLNPTNVIAPFTYQTIDQEEVPGVDAVRLRLATGPFSELDACFVFGETRSNIVGAAFARYRTQAMSADVSAIAMVFREHLLLGVDFARSVGSAGVWLEAAWTYGGAFGGRREESYAQVSVGADRLLTENLYGYLEYHYNQAGARSYRWYQAAAGRTAYRDGNTYLLGEHYLAPGLSWTPSALMSYSAHALINVRDPSALLALRLERSLGANVALDAGLFLRLGAQPDVVRTEFENGGFTTLRSNSEFGLYPSTYFTSLRYYF